MVAVAEKRESHSAFHLYISKLMASENHCHGVNYMPLMVEGIMTRQLRFQKAYEKIPVMSSAKPKWSQQEIHCFMKESLKNGISNSELEDIELSIWQVDGMSIGWSVVCLESVDRSSIFWSSLLLFLDQVRELALVAELEKLRGAECLRRVHHFGAGMLEGVLYDVLLMGRREGLFWLRNYKILLGSTLPLNWCLLSQKSCSLGWEYLTTSGHVHINIISYARWR